MGYCGRHVSKDPAMKSPFHLLNFLLMAMCLSASVSAPNAWGRTPVGLYSPQVPGAQSSEDADVAIPGPLRPFLRMAGISQKVSVEEVLPLLAHNVFTEGYEGSPTKGRPTEYLLLLGRYVQQAKELETLAGPDHMLRVADCDEAKPLLRILGYRVRQECGKSSTTVLTADPDRAFLTIDSGFPLFELEETLQGGKPFSYSFPATRVPVLFTVSEWTAASTENRPDPEDLVETFLHDPVLSRLYWALARSDPQSRTEFRKSIGLAKLLPYAATLDFYGSHICIRSGRVIVPGGNGAESAWKDLVGASPHSPVEFVPRLLGKDNGWLAAYFDALSRVSQSQQAHFTEPRLRRFYEALRGSDIFPAAARPAFRPAPGLLLLVTCLQWESDGAAHVPGNLEVWKGILRQKINFKLPNDWDKRVSHVNHSEQLVEAMFALSRVETETGPLQIYLMLSELDGRRSSQDRLSPQTVLLLAGKFAQFGDQYLLFSEFPELTDESITRFLTTAETLDRIPNHTLRGNAMGIFQANVGLWQVLARQGQIPASGLDSSWQAVIQPFSKIQSSPQLFDAGRDSLGALLLASSGQRN